MQIIKTFVSSKYKYLLIFIFILLFLMYNLTGSSFIFANEEEANMFYDLGKRNLQKRKFNKAIGYFQKAVEENPDFESAWYELGNAYYSKGDLKSAIKNYYIAMGVNQDFKKPLKRIGKCYLEQKKYNLAIKKFKNAGEHFPGDSSISYLTGQTYEKTGDWNNAISAYTRAENLDKEKYSFLKGKIEKLKKKADPHPVVTGPPPSAPTPEELPDIIPAEIPCETAVPSPLSTDAVAVDKSPSPGVKSSLSINGKGEIKARFPLIDDNEEITGKRLQVPINWLKTGLFATVILIFILGFIYLSLKITGKKKAVTKIGSPQFPDMPDMHEDFLEDDEDEEVEDFDAPSRFFYKEVIIGEREKRKVRHKDTILRIREKLKKEERDALLAGEERQSGTSSQHEDNIPTEATEETTTKMSGSFPEKEARIQSAGGMTSSMDKAGKTRETVEIEFEEIKAQKRSQKKTIEELAKKKKKHGLPAPFVCLCGKIIRNGVLVCPRCGRGTG